LNSFDTKPKGIEEEKMKNGGKTNKKEKF